MIRYFLSTVLMFLWALWLGGLIALVIIITTLAGAVSDRQVFGPAASAIFHRFEHYELTLAALSLAILLCWSLAAPARRKIVVFMLLLLAAAFAAYTRFSLVPKIDALRLQNLTTTPEFHRLHSASTRMYGYEILLLIVVGLLLPSLRSPLNSSSSRTK